MSIPILATKLYIPPLRPTIVNRRGLLERLHQGVARKLSLISAPAGFGKTTLVSLWVHSYLDSHDENSAYSFFADGSTPAINVAWLSLDERDNALSRFLNYLIAALQRTEPHLGTEIVPLLHSPQPPTTEAILTALLNELTGLSKRFLLVLDDYHLLTEQAITEALLFLLDNLPPQLHLVMTTREDPPLLLARLRARGHLTEVRAADLRFTTAEAAHFLNQMMGLDLTVTQIATLETRTEGWIAGLQMAALSMQNHADRSAFIRAFTGSNRFVLDYLAEEVLVTLPDALRTFLLQTAILDQMQASLCNAVIGGSDSQALLTTLERDNLFVIPLDDERIWYRYHHLFADVLRTRMASEQPHLLPQLHQRASLWYENNGLAADAIHHAFAANDSTRAANLVEQAWPVLLQGIHPGAWLRWVQQLPDDLIRVRPVLSTGYAWVLLDHGALEEAAARLDDAEQWLQKSEDAGNKDATGSIAGPMVVVNQQEFRSLPGTIASARAYMAQAAAQFYAATEHATNALALLAPETHYWRGNTALFLGMAHWALGNLAQATQAITNSIHELKQAGHTFLQVVGTVILADMQVAQGHSQIALRTYKNALHLAGAEAEEMQSPMTMHQAMGLRNPTLHGTVNLYVGMGMLYHEWGDLDQATHYFQVAQELSDQPVSPGSAARLAVARARTMTSQQHWSDALALLDEAEHLQQRDATPNFYTPAAMRTRIWLQQGRFSEAKVWAEAHGSTQEKELLFVHEFEQLTVARYQIAAYHEGTDGASLHGAISLLQRLLQAAEQEQRITSIIEILILLALAHDAGDDRSLALEHLTRALHLAQPQGYLQRFIDEGEPMQQLLAASMTQGKGDPDYVTKLLTRLQPTVAATTTAVDPNKLLIEPLSARELEVLQLLTDGHTNQAVADELVIALSTVKKHVNNIFGKLSVRNRTQAIHRARELKLL